MLETDPPPPTSSSPVFYNLGQTGTQILNVLLIADVTSTRWRSLATSSVFMSYIVSSKFTTRSRIPVDSLADLVLALSTAPDLRLALL